jgi:hypothetical protein
MLSGTSLPERLEDPEPAQRDQEWSKRRRRVDIGPEASETDREDAEADGGAHGHPEGGVRVRFGEVFALDDRLHDALPDHELDQQHVDRCQRNDAECFRPEQGGER